MTQKVTKRQQAVLDCIEACIREKGYGPTVREVCQSLGLSSPSTVHVHLKALEDKGFIKRDPLKSRSIALTYPIEEVPSPVTAFAAAYSKLVNVPLVGNVAAGSPILAEENITDTLSLPTEIVGDAPSFLLSVRGESMIEAGINDGDYVVVKEQPVANNGDIVVAIIDDGATVKRFFKESDHIRLQPENSTMDPIITTDCAIDGAVLQDMLRQVVTKTFNRITVDGDTSTNDTCVVLANGLAGNTPITGPGADYDTFFAALRHVCEYEAKMIASDGEGAGRLVTCTVQGAETEEQAEQMAKAVVRSPLVKCAMFGTDANWGRVLCAIGYSGAEFDPKDVAVSFQSKGGALQVCAGGQGVPFDEDLAKEILGQDEVTILVTLTAGQASCSCWGCDLTYDYVKINGDYRS